MTARDRFAWKVDEWARDRPFTLAVIVVMLIVVPGFFSIQKALSDAEAATHQASEVAASANAVTARNTQVVQCVTKWVQKETDALQDRDVINRTAAGAALDLWDAFYNLIEKPPANGRQVTLQRIDQYRDILRRLQKADRVNPYPEIEGCLAKPLPAVYALVSLHPGHPCWGRPATIRGTYRSDILRGTDGPDVIIGLKGDDLIFGGGGNDRICADRGDDTVSGGAGRDRGRGGRGDDYCVQVEKAKGC